MTSRYDARTLYRINADELVPVHGERRLRMLCECLANVKNLRCSYGAGLMAVIRGLRVRDDVFPLVDDFRTCLKFDEDEAVSGD